MKWLNKKNARHGQAKYEATMGSAMRAELYEGNAHDERRGFNALAMYNY